jgi:lysophospholipase L1-like esterase
MQGKRKNDIAQQKAWDECLTSRKTPVSSNLYKTAKGLRMLNVSLRRSACLLIIAAIVGLVPRPMSGQEKMAAFELKKGDRIAWVGSSSTNIGVWPKTMEFLLRTRHPDLALSFKKCSTGGGTFATGLQNLDKWLDEFHPTVVCFNYGGNDAGAGEKGLTAYKDNMAKCVAKVEAAKARVLFTAFQGADVRKAGAEPAVRRKLYAETQLAFCKAKGWPIVDVFHPTDALQGNAQKDDDKYTILRDKIHLTDPAYIAWGFYLYDGLGMKPGVSECGLHADGTILTQVGCKVDGVKINESRTEISFLRADAVLPILPPGPLPPRKYVPMEQHSAYLLRVTGLKEGMYEIQCDAKTIGFATADALAKGVNLNSVVLDSGLATPWDGLAKQVWAGKDLNQIGSTNWRFRIIRK